MPGIISGHMSSSIGKLRVGSSCGARIIVESRAGRRTFALHLATVWVRVAMEAGVAALVVTRSSACHQHMKVMTGVLENEGVGRGSTA